MGLEERGGREGERSKSCWKRKRDGDVKIREGGEGRCRNRERRREVWKREERREVE